MITFHGKGLAYLKRYLSTFVAACALVALSSAALAATDRITANVERIQTQAGIYGGCMAYLNPSPGTLGLNCSNWVTMSCDGTLQSKSAASHAMSQAQLAMVTGYYVIAQITDSQDINGICFAERITVIGQVVDVTP